MSLSKKRLDSLRRERLVSLTRDLVLIPGSEKRPGELRRALHWIRNHLEPLDGVELRDYESEGVLSLLATPVDDPHPEVVMFGHVDVVHHSSRESYQSEIEGSIIRGPGTGDMKGIVAILLELFRNFHSRCPGVSLGLAITTDEERGGEHGTRALVEELGLRCKVALVPDGGSIDQVVVEEKGILQIELESQGQSCHAARPWLGQNALDQLISTTADIRAVIESLSTRAEGGDHWHSSCTLTRLDTPNLSGNRVPSHATATLDIRFPRPLCASDVLEAIEQRVPPSVRVQGVLSAEPTVLQPDPAFFDACESVLGRHPQELREHGGSDARFLAARDIPVIMSRPVCGNLHSRQEWIDIDSMVQFFEIYRKYLNQRLFG